MTAAAARASLLYDIENDIAADAKIGKFSVEERILAKEHLAAFAKIETGFGKQKTIVIFDRGYPSKDFIKYWPRSPPGD